MNPWLIGAALVLAFGAGWQVNGWRIEADRLGDENRAYAAAIAGHGRKLDTLTDIAQRAAERDAAAERAQREGFDAIAAYVEKGVTCRLSDADAGILRENARRRAAARDR